MSSAGGMVVAVRGWWLGSGWCLECFRQSAYYPPPPGSVQAFDFEIVETSPTALKVAWAQSIASRRVGFLLCTNSLANSTVPLRALANRLLWWAFQFNRKITV